MKHIFIINPEAGNGQGYKFIPFIEKLAKENKKDYKIEVTCYIGHATKIAKKYANEKENRIYSVGGDGTANEVLNGMVGAKNAMAVLPGGSGNDFIRTLAKKCTIKNYFFNVINGKQKLVDVGKLDNRYFLNIASVGMDAKATYEAIKYKRNSILGGKMAYIIGGLLAFKNHHSYNLEIKIDGEYYKQSVMMIIIANGKYYGGGIKASPKADIDDGLFNITLLPKCSFLDLLGNAYYFVLGMQNKSKYFIRKKAKKIEIYSKCLLPIQFDGETTLKKNITFEICPKAVKIIFPAHD